MIRVISPSLLIVASILTPRIALAQDVTLKDAIQCKDFTHNSDGSWFAKDVSLNYGPAGSQQQVNLFGPTTIRQGKNLAGGVDLWAVLNAKCGTGK